MLKIKDCAEKLNITEAYYNILIFMERHINKVDTAYGDPDEITENEAKKVAELHENLLTHKFKNDEPIYVPLYVIADAHAVTFDKLVKIIDAQVKLTRIEYKKEGANAEMYGIDINDLDTVINMVNSATDTKNHKPDNEILTEMAGIPLKKTAKSKNIISNTPSPEPPAAPVQVLRKFAMEHKLADKTTLALLTDFEVTKLVTDKYIILDKNDSVSAVLIEADAYKDLTRNKKLFMI